MAESNQFHIGGMWVTALCVTFLAYLIYVVVQRKVVKYPPGPWGLPLVGYLPFIRGQPFRHFWELKKKYGDVLSFNALGKNFVVLNSYEVIKECFQTKADDFSGRIVDKKSVFTITFEGLGFQQEEGPTLREYRRFTINTLRDFGFGKLSLEGRVQEIGGDLIQGFEKTGGKPFVPLNLLTIAPFNVILYLTTDKRYEPDDPDFAMICRHIKVVLTKVPTLKMFTGTLLSRFIPAEWHPNYKYFSKIKKDFEEFTGKLFREHEETFEKNNLRDFIDACLAERYSKMKDGKEDDVFTIQRLQVIVLNLLLAGSETSSITLHWAFKLISERPDIQSKLQKELDKVVGRDRLPSILDKPNMPYIEAFILEVLRFSSIAPLGAPHSNSKTASLSGYTIPAKSIIVANLWGVHNDPDFWKEPERFDPDRFLEPATKAKRRERVVSFSTGKRSCLGESLARMELFLFLTMLLQKFNFKLHVDEEEDKTEMKTLARLQEPYKICAIPRYN